MQKWSVEDIENFIDDYDKWINELAYGLEDISEKMVVSFKLKLRSPDMTRIDSEIRRLEEILLNNKKKKIYILHSQMVPPKGIIWLFSCPDI